MRLTLKTARALLAAARDPLRGRPLGRNTRLVSRAGGAVAVRFHSTDVLTFLPDGRTVVVRMGGWNTVTTRARIREFSNVDLATERGEPVVFWTDKSDEPLPERFRYDPSNPPRYPRRRTPFAEGMRFHAATGRPILPRGAYVEREAPSPRSEWRTVYRPVKSPDAVKRPAPYSRSAWPDSGDPADRMRARPRPYVVSPAEIALWRERPHFPFPSILRPFRPFHRDESDPCLPYCLTAPDALPGGWALVTTHFVDSSGFGGPGEPALSAPEFVERLVPGHGYLVVGVGQFQVYVAEYSRRGAISVSTSEETRA